MVWPLSFLYKKCYSTDIASTESTCFLKNFLIVINSQLRRLLQATYMSHDEQQGALPSKDEHFFSFPLETPKEQILALRNKLITLIQIIEEITYQPLLCDHMDFLDKVASTIMALHQLTLLPSSNQQSLAETKQLISNILSCLLLVPKIPLEISLLDAAKLFRKDRKNKEALTLILKNCSKEQDSAQDLITDLKLLAFDLIEEKENI